MGSRGWIGNFDQQRQRNGGRGQRYTDARQHAGYRGLECAGTGAVSFQLFINGGLLTVAGNVVGGAVGYAGSDIALTG